MDHTSGSQLALLIALLLESRHSINSFHLRNAFAASRITLKMKWRTPFLDRRTISVGPLSRSLAASMVCTYADPTERLVGDRS